MKCLPMPGKKVTIILKCIAQLMAYILRSTEHIRNFVRSSVSKCIDISNIVYG